MQIVLFYESFIKFYFNYALTVWEPKSKFSNIKCSTVFLLININNKQCLEIWIRWIQIRKSMRIQICKSMRIHGSGSNGQNIQRAKYLSKTAKKFVYSSLKMQYIKLVNKGVDFWPNSNCIIPKTLQPDGVNLFIPNIWSNRTQSLKFIRHGNYKIRICGKDSIPSNCYFHIISYLV